MKTNCDCSQNVRAGSFQGVNFRICTKCQYLQWEEREGLTFIRPEFEFLFELPDTQETFELIELFTWLEGALAAFQGGVLNLGIDYEGLGLLGIGDFHTDEVTDLVEDYQQDRAVLLTIVSNVSTWQLEASEAELEGALPHLVASKLDSYTTQEILAETLGDMWYEMGDYMLGEQAKRLQAFLSTQETPGWKVDVSLNGFDLVNPLPLPWDQAAVEPVISRSETDNG